MSELKIPEVTGEGPVPLDAAAAAATPLLMLNLGNLLRVEVARRVAGHQRARLAATTAITQSAVVMVVVAW